MWFYAIIGILMFTILLYLILEVHYFVRVLLCVIMARLSKKKTHILNETNVNGFCLTNDIDTMLSHMNNSRFLRELDFAKIDFYERTGLYKCIKKNGGSLVIGASTIRYRRFIKLFTRFQITTKVIYWDDHNIYLEHRFLNRADQFVNAICLCKTRLVDCNAEQVMNELIVNYSSSSKDGDIENCKREKPEISLELSKWMESNDISSELLRKT